MFVELFFELLIRATTFETVSQNIQKQKNAFGVESLIVKTVGVGVGVGIGIGVHQTEAVKPDRGRTFLLRGCDWSGDHSEAAVKKFRRKLTTLILPPLGDELMLDNFEKKMPTPTPTQTLMLMLLLSRTISPPKSLILHRRLLKVEFKVRPTLKKSAKSSEGDLHEVVRRDRRLG